MFNQYITHNYTLHTPSG